MEEQRFRQCVGALTFAFVLTVLLGQWLIPVLHRLKFGQEVREDGPQAHLKKQGTPTMGGIMFLISISAAVLIETITAGVSRGELSGSEKEMLLVLLMTAGFGLIGFWDDFLKIKKHQSEGLNPSQKLLLQLALTIVFALFSYSHTEAGADVYIPFTGYGVGALKWTLPLWLYVPFVLFVVLGTDNGVNFTDGLDGLCGSVTIVVAAFFAAVGMGKGSGIALPAMAVIGALMGFLLYNAYPAKVFMGDTGSLALGGFVASAAVVSGLELYVPIVGFVYMAEVISVIIQVVYFKKTHGKRFFKMAPIHHHFELCGNSETRIDTAFTVTTALLSLVAFAGLIR